MFEKPRYHPSAVPVTLYFDGRARDGRGLKAKTTTHLVPGEPREGFLRAIASCSLMRLVAISEGRSLTLTVPQEVLTDPPVVPGEDDPTYMGVKVRTGDGYETALVLPAYNRSGDLAELARVFARAIGSESESTQWTPDMRKATPITDADPIEKTVRAQEARLEKPLPEDTRAQLIALNEDWRVLAAEIQRLGIWQAPAIVAPAPVASELAATAAAESAPAEQALPAEPAAATTQEPSATETSPSPRAAATKSHRLEYTFPLTPALTITVTVSDTRHIGDCHFGDHMVALRKHFRQVLAQIEDMAMRAYSDRKRRERESVEGKGKGKRKKAADAARTPKSKQTTHAADTKGKSQRQKPRLDSSRPLAGRGKSKEAP